MQMDNIGELLGPILSDPESMQQLRDVAKQLGLGDAQEPQPKVEKEEKGLPFDIDMFEAISKVTPLLSEINKEDDASRLLNAIRPYLGENRKRKADEAQKLLGLMRILNLLKDQNVF